MATEQGNKNLFMFPQWPLRERVHCQELDNEPQASVPMKLFGADRLADPFLRDYRYRKKGMPQTESPGTYEEGCGVG